MSSRELSFVVALLFAAPAWGLEHVTFRQNDADKHVSGKLLIEAQDGGLLLIGSDGTMYAVQPDELVKRSHDDVPFVPLDAAALGKQLLATLPDGFEVHTTAHYVICHNTSRAYAEWCGALYERLFRAFTNFWSRKGFDLHDPEFPLVAIVFANREDYLRHARLELGASADAIVGYYNMQTNRITMYDLTGVESLRQPGGARSSAAQINFMLAQPDAENTVATIIHEATHQIAFNSGLQTRFADIPLWVSEGIAVYFETPDLQSTKGWKTIGAVNQPRLSQFRQYQATRPPNSLRSLIVDDQRMRDSRRALDAYAEAWALNYFLLRQKPKEFLAYLKTLSAKPAMQPDEPEKRLEEFQNAFGKDLNKFDAEFVRNLQKVR
jgi:hypothetical protein